MNVTAVVDGTNATVQWQANAQVSQDEVTGYRVYRLSGDNKTLVRELGPNQFTTVIGDLQSGVEHVLGVSALRGDEESGIGYPVSIVIQSTWYWNRSRHRPWYRY